MSPQRQIFRTARPALTRGNLQLPDSLRPEKPSVAVAQALIVRLARTVHRRDAFSALFILVVLRLALRSACVFGLNIL
jgi:hypothetical protein